MKEKIWIGGDEALIKKTVDMTLFAICILSCFNKDASNLKASSDT